MLELFTSTVFELGYIGFFLYMIMVGTFIPLPTQLILLPAGYLASQGKLDILLIIIITASGTTIGATINYFLAEYISKKFLDEKKLYKIKKFFLKYGKASVALAPLTFGLGQYISIPAGIAKMDLRWFLPLIFFSNSLWNFSMLMLGYLFGEEASSYTLYLVLGGTFLVIATVVTFVYKEFKSY